jgi:predicted DsbA family dithiol-disulfide isomerase
MKNSHRIILAVWLVFACWPSAAFSADSASLPWSVLPRVRALNESLRNELMDELKAVPNYGTCKGTMYQCLTSEKPDQTAVRFANFGAYLLSRGVPPQSLGFLARERAKFFNEVPAQAFTYTDSPSLGSEKAKIVITEFAEFKCTYCEALSPILKKLVADSKGKVRLIFKHFPIKNHPGTLLTSRAAQAAYYQGKFWEMSALLYKHFDKQSPEDILGYAKSLGMDVDRFRKDMEDPRIEQLIERDKMEGVRAKVVGTPTVFINGKMYILRHDEDFLEDFIDEEAEHLGIEPPYQDWVYTKLKR